MAEFLLALHGGKMPESEEEGAKMMAAWQAWYEAMGDAVVNPGNPVGMSRTVAAGGVTEGGGANPVSGFLIVKAADQDAACEIAKGCPIVADESGSVEVAGIVEM